MLPLIMGRASPARSPSRGRAEAAGVGDFPPLFGAESETKSRGSLSDGPPLALSIRRGSRLAAAGPGDSNTGLGQAQQVTELGSPVTSPRRRSSITLTAAEELELDRTLPSVMLVSNYARPLLQQPLIPADSDRGPWGSGCEPSGKSVALHRQIGAAGAEGTPSPRMPGCAGSYTQPLTPEKSAGKRARRITSGSEHNPMTMFGMWIGNEPEAGNAPKTRAAHPEARGALCKGLARVTSTSTDHALGQGVFNGDDARPRFIDGNNTLGGLAGLRPAASENHAREQGSLRTTGSRSKVPGGSSVRQTRRAPFHPDRKPPRGSILKQRLDDERFENPTRTGPRLTFFETTEGGPVAERIGYVIGDPIDPGLKWIPRKTAAASMRAAAGANKRANFSADIGQIRVDRIKPAKAEATGPTVAVRHRPNTRPHAAGKQRKEHKKRR